jgi:dihydrodipicolinate synthase/N-acetylneuraminate lyase
MNVIPIPPSYDKNQKLSLNETEKYLDYLYDNEVSTIMTTAGTSQFNLLNLKEISDFNSISDKYPRKSIIGLPPLSTVETIKFIRDNPISSNSYYMALYPDRYYSAETIIDYFVSIRQYTENPLYLHGMFTRSGFGGTWNYTHDILTELYESNIIIGIKEEHSELTASYNVLSQCPKNLDVIVAGGSMRRHQFLRSAGGNSYLAGVGNFFPKIEIDYNNGKNIDHCLSKETKLFNVFGKYGWHRSLRAGLSILGLCCFFDRQPYPVRDKNFLNDIENILTEINDD